MRAWTDTTLVGRLLPDWAVAAETSRDVGPATLFPAEGSVVARAVPKRRAEFATVRACARSALGSLGVPPAPILPGVRGEPRWPAGVVGSMTHCAGYRAAAVALVGDAAALGIDAEPNGALPRSVLTTVARPEECAHLAALSATRPGPHWDRLLFSAKESVYKAWYPLTERWLDFHDVSVAFDADAGSFVARLLVADPRSAGRELGTLRGGFAATADLLVTAVVVPA